VEDILDPLKVLIVEDDEAMRSLLKIALSIEENVGEVREAVDGSAALRMLKEFTPDLVVLDYRMPGVNGGEVAYHVRTHHPGAKIVAFSGVLDNRPDWADEYFVKGRMPGIDVLVDLTRSEQPA
jgi:CheY-like chemotaxis protein